MYSCVCLSCSDSAWEAAAKPVVFQEFRRHVPSLLRALSGMAAYGFFMPRTTNEIGKLGVDLGNSGNSWWVYYGELPCYCCFFSCFFPQDAKLEDRESTPHCPKFLPYTQRSWQIPWVILRITRLPDSLWIICLVVSAIKVCANTLRNNQKLCQVLATANFDLLLHNDQFQMICCNFNWLVVWNIFYCSIYWEQ